MDGIRKNIPYRKMNSIYLVNNLSITTTKESTLREYGHNVGMIRIGDFQESFSMSLLKWSLNDYKTQWHEGLSRLENLENSCLVVNIESALLEWWVLYKQDNVVVIRNELFPPPLFRKYIGKNKFTTNNCYEFIRPYQKYNPDGHEISEWRLPWFKQT